MFDISILSLIITLVIIVQYTLLTTQLGNNRLYSQQFQYQKERALPKHIVRTCCHKQCAACVTLAPVSMTSTILREVVELAKALLRPVLFVCRFFACLDHLVACVCGRMLIQGSRSGDRWPGSIRRSPNMISGTLRAAWNQISDTDQHDKPGAANDRSIIEENFRSYQGIFWSHWVSKGPTIQYTLGILCMISQKAKDCHSIVQKTLITTNYFDSHFCVVGCLF
jgi:hypothetical protein